ncbi:uncharacterized protein [Triticum aestivum]|uniref:uncharacterized protein n=1 Tax=Triticum aestivum TaxID=4565 RepID=UPI001D00BC9C|nr:uncharacterized protein LOC123059250 [Triticum aestivum]
MGERATGRATGATAAAASSLAAGDGQRVGGRFWALADPDEEDADDDRDGIPAGSPPSLTPSDLICEFFHSGYDEDEVATTVDGVLPPDDPARIGLHAGEKKEMIRCVVHWRAAATAIKPWKGPLPKVIFKATALIRSWSLLTPTEAREHLVIESIRWEMITPDIFNRFG